MLLASLEVTKKEVNRALASLAADGQQANNSFNNTTPAVGLLASNGSVTTLTQSVEGAAVGVSCIVTSLSLLLPLSLSLPSAGDTINNSSSSSSSKFILSSNSSCDPKFCCSSSIFVSRVIGRRSSHDLVVLQECDHLTV